MEISNAVSFVHVNGDISTVQTLPAERRKSITNNYNEDIELIVPDESHAIPHRSTSSLRFVGEDDLNCRDADTKGVLLSLGTVFVFIFLFFIMLLGCSLIAIAVTSSAQANDLQNKGAEDIRSRLLNLTNSSTDQLQKISALSIDLLVQQVFEQMSGKLQAVVSNYVSEAQISVSGMESAWLQGDLSGFDLDRTLHNLWNYLILFPTVSEVSLGDAATGNTVSIEKMQSGQFLIGIENKTGASCRICFPGMDRRYKYYYKVSRPYQTTNLTFYSKKVYDPRTRVWYVAAKSGNGLGRWADIYSQTSGLGVGCTAAMLVKDATGSELGVVGSDIDLTFLSIFLAQIKEQLVASVQSVGKLEASVAKDHLNIVVTNVFGTMVGTSSNDSITQIVAGTVAPAHWSSVVRTPTLRSGLELANKTWNGNWTAIFAAGYRTYQDDSGALFVSTLPVLNDWGFDLIIIGVCPMSVFRGHFDQVMSATVLKISNESKATEDTTDAIKAQVDSDLKRNQTVYLSICAVIISLECILVFMFTNLITRTLGQVGDKMADVAKLNFNTEPVYISRALSSVKEIKDIGKSFQAMATDLESYGKYVPRNVMRILASHAEIAHLGVSPREVSIFFSDIKGFTTMSESLDPKVLISLLAEYLQTMSSCIEESGGTVGKYIGDAIMAFWNSPEDVADHEAVACLSALAQQRLLARLRAKWCSQGLPEVRARMGLSTGTVLHGNIGSHARMEWGLIGDEVNLAARLESMGKQYGVEILISGRLYDRVRHRLLTRPIDRVVAVGKSAATDIHELVAERAAATAEQRQYCGDFEAVVAAYRARQFLAARNLAVSFAQRFAGDVAALKYVERCDSMLRHPPPPEWDGTHVLTEK